MRYRSCGRSLVLLVWLALGTTLLQGQSTNVLTWHNDIGRTGLNSSETILTQTNVNKSQFGKICSSAPGTIDGQLLAQPLVATGTIKGHNYVVYLATMNDSVYAFDGDSSTCAPILHVSLLPSGEKAVNCADVGDRQCHALAPIIGILSTPVIDLASNTIYVVTNSESTNPSCAAHSPSSACFIHRLHALDLTTLKEQFKGPVSIVGRAGSITFFSRGHIQRPGLLLVPKARPNGHAGLYVAFSMIDGAPNRPNGWVFGYDAKNLTAKPNVFITTPGAQAGGGGVWGSGAGIAVGVDSPGGNSYLYFTTGDGVFDVSQGKRDYGDSFVKLAPSLSLVANGFFTPFDQDCLESKDLDLGASGVMLIPEGVGSSKTNFAVTAGKDGNIYVMDRANPGGYNGTSQGCPGQGSNLNVETFPGSTFSYHTTAAYWNQNLYFVAGKSQLNKYQISSTCNPGPVCTTPVASSSNKFFYGPVPSVSSNSNVSGSAIVWAIHGDAWPSIGRVPAPAVLYAYDAEHVGANNTVPELWDSTQCPTRDLAGNSTKFTVPTIANGMVYIGTMDPTDSTNTRGELDVYGLVTGACN